ncbi:MAG: response regulator [Burkholderiales bacterium]
MIRVLIADDQKILREGLRALLGMKEDISVVGEAGDGREACELARQTKPDVVLMDIRMPQMDGVEAAKIIKSELPKTAVIMLTTFDDDEYVIKAMTYGASGYLLKDIDSDKLIEAVRDGVNGSIILPGRIAAKITSRLSGSGSASYDFSEREKEIIRLLTAGKSNAEIAKELYLSTGTVKNYVSQIYLKLGVKDRANAVIALKNAGF